MEVIMLSSKTITPPFQPLAVIFICRLMPGLYPEVLACGEDGKKRFKNETTELLKLSNLTIEHNLVTDN